MRTQRAIGSKRRAPGRFFFIYIYDTSSCDRIWYCHSMASRKRCRRLGSRQRAILQELSLGDILYAHFLSATSTKRYHKLAHEHATERYRRKRALEQLELMDYIQRQGDRLSISSKGRSAITDAVSYTNGLLQTKTWDYKWRIVVFDIPEKYAALRNRVRDVLKRAGFIRLQNSVWVFPHECAELIGLIKDEPRLSRYILYGVLERIEDGDRLRKLFRL